MRTLTMTIEPTEAEPGRQGPAGLLNRWLKLLLALLLLWTFAFVLAPALKEGVPAIKTLAAYIERSGIDAGAIYYTEVEEVGEADQAVRNTFRFYLEKEQPE